MQVTPVKIASTRSLMSSSTNWDMTVLIKKIHMFKNSSDEEMIRILTDTEYDEEELIEPCRKVYRDCEICSSTGRPASKRKVSITHVNEAFNSSIQADFVTFTYTETSLRFKML